MLAHGQSLGVIGRNGAGKSTLLRVLAGVARPTEGSVATRARVACLLDLGVGFHALETGRENAETALVLQAGLTRREARRRVAEVEEFAGLGAFFERPMRTYSDGMRLRLAFATITVLEPEVLVTDEILAVGDDGFQERCNAWFDRFLGGGGGRIQGGRVLDYSGKPDRQLCRLHLSLMDKMGVRPERFGDATQPLAEV